MSESDLYTNNKIPEWCPGCGNFSILASLKAALNLSNIPPEKTVIAGDIGCSAKNTDYIASHAFTGLHGRAVPLACGIKLANHDLNVIAIGGDGGIYGEGTAHFVHAARRNQNITLIVNNNKVYALTKGQPSPTTDQKLKSEITPDGIIEEAFNPIAVALSSGATFVSRGFAGNIENLTGIILKAINHDGFSLVDILAPCVSFNKVNTLKWYEPRIYKIEDDKDYNPKDLMQAYLKSHEWGEKIPTGIFYEVSKPSFEKQIKPLKEQTLIRYPVEKRDISALITLY